MPLNDVPQPNQNLQQTQNPIRQNFQNIGAAWIIDHVDYGLPDVGKHNRITFPVQVAAPVTGVNEVSLYSMTSALTGIPELSFRHDSAGAAYEFTSCVAASPGWARLPSGILLKWGNSNMGAPGTNVYTFPVAGNIPPFTQIFNIIVTTAYNGGGGDGNGFARLNNFGAPWTQFTVYGSQRTTTAAAAVAYAYLAIGI